MKEYLNPDMQNKVSIGKTDDRRLSELVDVYHVAMGEKPLASVENCRMVFADV